MDWSNAMQATLDIALPLLGTVVTVIAIPALMAWLKANNIVTDKAQADLLQSALANAAQTAIARAGGATAMGVASRAQTDAAVAYVKASVPGTVAAKGLSDSAIADLAVPHIQRAIDAAAKPSAAVSEKVAG